MFLISKISPTKKIGFSNIYLNNSYSFTISDFTLATFKLKENLSISTYDIEQILTIELTERFKNYCLNILGGRPRSEKEIDQKLKLRIRKYKEEWPILNIKNPNLQDPNYKQKKENMLVKNVSLTSQQYFYLNEKVAEQMFITAKKETFEFLKKYEYLNEKQFAIWLVNQRLNQGKGKLFIKQDLLNKGLSKDIISDVLKNISFKESIKPVYDKALKKYFKEEDANKKKQKIYRYLLSRGFSYDEISEVLKPES